jgi:FkbM family methyltransferase
MLKKIIRKTFNAFGLDVHKKNAKVKFFPYFLDKEVEGVKFNFFIGDSDGKEWYHKGARDPHWFEMKFVKDNLIQEGDIVYECGSHHGCAAILLSDWVGKNGKVKTFEPNPVNYEISKINLNNNAIENVELIKAAVGIEAGEVQIDTTSSNSSVVTNISRSNSIYSVKMINLDSLEESAPNLLKIDVEGYETDVLKGAKRILESKPGLAIEIHAEQLPKYNTSVDEIFDLIGRDNYDFWVQWDDSKDPVPYKFEKPIVKRAHLFGIPK